MQKKKSVHLYIHNSNFTMDQCKDMMENPLAKCLYWGFILLLLLVVIYHLRNPAEHAIGTLESCAHGECKNLQKSNKVYCNLR